MLWLSCEVLRLASDKYVAKWKHAKLSLNCITYADGSRKMRRLISKCKTQVTVEKPQTHWCSWLVKRGAGIRSNVSSSLNSDFEESFTYSSTKEICGNINHKLLNRMKLILI